MTIELSPAGVARERACPCTLCQADTWNHSGRCDRCRIRPRDFDVYELHDCDVMAP